MSISWLVVAVVLAVMALLALNIWASIAAWRCDLHSRSQATAQLALIWLVPVVGAFLTLEIIRREAPPSDDPLAAHEPNQQVAAALRPLARGGTKTARLTLESEIVESLPGGSLTNPND